MTTFVVERSNLAIIDHPQDERWWYEVWQEDINGETTLVAVFENKEEAKEYASQWKS